MVTTTTKTLNYSIIRGNHTNSVNATITSTPGFNVNYFGKIPGILKIIELVVIIVALGLAASRRREGRQAPLEGNQSLFLPSVETWLAEYFLLGEVFFLCVHTAGLVWVFAVLLTYAMHIVSSVIVPKTTIHEVVFNFIFILMFWTAGIVELAETIPNGWAYPPLRADMAQGDWGCRVAAGVTTVVALGLVASRRREGGARAVSWPIEFFLAGEVFFLCVATASLVYLFGQLTTFCWSVTSSVLIPKTTYLEVILNVLFVLMWITAGIVLLCMTTREGWNYPFVMAYSDWGCRIAAGALGLFLGVFFIASLALAIKEFTGPRNQMMVVVALALVASLRDERQLQAELMTNNGSFKYMTYSREMFLSGEVYFLCAQTLALGVLCMLLLTYAFHTVSSMLLPKATALECTVNLLLALVVLVAGIVEIVQTEQWKYSTTRSDLYLYSPQEYGKRLAAGIIALITGVFFLISFALAQKELQGPKPV